MKALLIVCASLATLPVAVLATMRSVTLSVPTMDCPVCPITVKKALTRVAGVSGAEVNLERRQAKVTFDDAKTSVDALTRATRAAGYPSTVIAEPK